MTTWAIHHGDCLDAMAQMPAASVDTTVTSPPYNQLASRMPKNPTGMHAKNAWISKTCSVGYADDMPEDNYAEWLSAVASSVARVTKPGGSYFFNHKCRYRGGEVIHPIDYARSWPGWRLHQEIVWDRRGAFAFNCRKFAPSDERIYWMVRDGANHYWNQPAAGLMTVWPISPNSCERIDGHPCPFPIEIARRCMIATTPPGGVVLDPFMGSGSTGVAALIERREFVGIEKDEQYVSLARRRLRRALRPSTARDHEEVADAPLFQGSEAMQGSRCDQSSDSVAHGGVDAS